MRIVIEATPEEFAAMLSKLTNPKFEVRIDNTDSTAVNLNKYIPDVEIDSMNLTVRSTDTLKAAGLTNLRQLLHYTENELLKTPNLGRKSLNEIKTKLSEMGYAFKQ